MGDRSVISPGETYTFTATPQDNGVRLDSFMSDQFPTYSRSFFKKLIEQSCITINNKAVTKAGTLLKTDDLLVLSVPIPEEKELLSKEQADKLGVTLIHQEKDFAIINKPAGLMTHAPHSDSKEISLVDWLLAHFSSIKDVGYDDRPGIVHRLDKETSGIMVVPLTKQAHAAFSELFHDRNIQKTYLAMVHGHPEKEGEIDFPLGRHQTVRNKQTHRIDGRNATTRYKVLEYFDDHTLVEVYPKTGRTHQIRVHFATVGHPLIADKLYGKHSPMIKRHALHASELSFIYNNKQYHFKAPLPGDFKKLQQTIERLSGKN